MTIDAASADSARMPVCLQMPALSGSVSEWTVTRWLKRPGDTVEVGEPLLEVSSADADTQIPSSVAGVLMKIVTREAESVAVGGELALIHTAIQSRPESVKAVTNRDPVAPSRQLSPPEAETSQPRLKPVKLLISGDPLDIATILEPNRALSRSRPAAEVSDTTIAAARLLSLAKEAADKLTSTAEEDANLLLSDARARAEAMLSEANGKADALRVGAEREHSEIMSTIDQQRTVLEGRLRQLRTFEQDYRARLRSDMELQIAKLGPPTVGNAAFRNFLQLKLEELTGQPSAAPAPGASEPVSTLRSLTADDIRNVAFSRPPTGKRGYNQDEVDAFLDMVEARFMDPTSNKLSADDVRNVAFSRPRIGTRGYNEDEVDAFLEVVARNIEREINGS